MRDVVFTKHALMEMARRNINESTVLEVLASFDQEYTVRPGRKVYQSCIQYGDPPKYYLVRVFVDVDRNPPEVVTVYKTSKIKKYWREGK